MKHITIILMLIAMLPLSAITYHIKQDGTGDFTTITAGIDAAVNGNILLVYPGRYFENINYNGKNITITSLYDGGEDKSIVAQTIIDGNQQGSVVVFLNSETRDAVLSGFTITNGSGDFHHNHNNKHGGGIYIYNSASPVISNCIIEFNRAAKGSAIHHANFYTTGEGNPLLEGNTIRYNHSSISGAITNSMNSNLVFSTELLNNVYLNHGTTGSDISLNGRRQTPVVVDTFTVMNPDKFFAIRDKSNVPENFSFIVLNGKIEPVEADLYVSPNGSDENSGLSHYEPLQTISRAMMIIQPDSLQQRTIFVAGGTYSRSLNNQLFPVGIRSHIDIIGERKDNTIIDLENETLGFNLIGDLSLHQIGIYEVEFSYTNFVAIKNFTIKNGGGIFSLVNSGSMRFDFIHSITLEDIIITESHTDSMGPIRFYHCYDINIKNLQITDSSGDLALSIGSSFMPPDVYLENIKINKMLPKSIIPYPPPTTPSGTGGGLFLRSGSSGGPIEIPYKATIVNLEIAETVGDNYFWPWIGSVWGSVSIMGIGDVRLINSTIGDNSVDAVYGTALHIGGTNVDIYNSIIYGNTPRQIIFSNPYTWVPTVNIKNSIIQDGLHGFFYYQDAIYDVVWDISNLDTDPLWMGDLNEDYPYMLSANSPAIDAGTRDIPDFEFPEFDLAGNPRLYGNTIDIGAYEWNPNQVSVDEPEKTMLSSDYKIYNFPNPVTSLTGNRSGGGTGTTIQFKMPTVGYVEIEIYNLKGQFVRRLFNASVPAGEYNAFWDGRDERNRIVSTGFYMYQLKVNDKTMATGRCTFIK